MSDRMKRGNELRPDQQREVLRAYVYRNTVENHIANPQAARAANAKLPPISDAEWLRITEFPMTSKGEIDRRTRFCFTNTREVPAWQAVMEEWSARKAA